MSAWLRFISILLLCHVIINEMEAATPEESSLLEALREASAIAYEKRLNIDDIPEFVTVLRREKLRALGISNLFEALSLVPGIQTSIMQNGIKKVVMRGYDNPDNFTFDKYRLIIDEHPIQTSIFQNSSYYLNYPVELIERIEVILGPAAALQTSGALTGVIKVTTRIASPEKERAIFVEAGSYREKMAGIVQKFPIGASGDLGMELYYRRHDRGVDAQKYILEGTSPKISKSSEWLRDYTVGAVYNNGGFTLTARSKREHHGNYFGWEEHLELTDKPSMDNKYLYLQGLYKKPLSANEDFGIRLDYSSYKIVSDAQNYAETPIGYLPYTFDLYLSERSWQLETFLSSRRFENHLVKTGFYAYSAKQLGNSLNISFPDGSDTASTMTIDHPKRNTLSLYANDFVTITKDVDGQFGIRYDRLSDMKKGYFSINTSLLFRITPNWSAKAGYGHAFRAPSWIELYSNRLPGIREGDPNLKAEEADMIEGSIIYKPSLHAHLQANLYKSRIKNLLDIYERPRSDPNGPGYANHPSRSSQGLELFYRLQTPINHTMELGYSYNHTDYITERGVHQPMPGVARHKATAAYMINFDASLSLCLYCQYIGTRPVNADTNKEPIPPYTTIDTTFSYITPKGWRLFLSIKNIFDENVTNLSYYGRHENIIRPGRTGSLSLEFPL